MRVCGKNRVERNRLEAQVAVRSSEGFPQDGERCELLKLEEGEMEWRRKGQVWGKIPQWSVAGEG